MSLKPPKITVMMETLSPKNHHHQQHPKRDKIIHQIPLPCPSSTSEPAPEIQNIPNELIFEILSHLPVKSLLRFECVSKSWLSLISSQYFIKTHLIKSSNNHKYTLHRLLFRTVDKSVSKGYFKFRFKQVFLRHALDAHMSPAATVMDDSLACNKDYFVRPNPRMFYYPRVDIVGSCNGLICVNAHQGTFLWNPSLRKSRRLPNFSPKSKETWEFMVYGFGYDESDDDYKVFKIPVTHSRGHKNARRWIDVYSRNSDSWRRIGDFKGGVIGKGLCFVSGKLHWIRSIGGEVYSLDLVGETYGELERPKYEAVLFERSLKVLGGCLSVVYYYQNRDVAVWIMKEYGVKDSWTKVASLPKWDDPNLRWWTPVFLLKDGKLLLQYWSRKGLALCNPKDNSLTSLPITNLDTTLQVNTFVESLVSPCGGTSSSA